MFKAQPNWLKPKHIKSSKIYPPVRSKHSHQETCWSGWLTGCWRPRLRGRRFTSWATSRPATLSVWGPGAGSTPGSSPGMSHVLSVTSHVSYVICHVSCVICHVSCFMCRVSCVICYVMCDVLCVIWRVSRVMCHVSFVMCDVLRVTKIKAVVS